VGFIEYRSRLSRELVVEALLAFVLAAKQATGWDKLAILAAAGLNPHLGNVLLSALDAAHAKGPTHLNQVVCGLILCLECGNYVYQVHGSLTRDRLPESLYCVKGIITFNFL
jgi:hypothetical protein